ncbi:hypothetical protein OIU85_000636 [Salix viminalis]|uniref:Uncharacterized protein n=1 Tax=Salix viminalis TaxID=40686 RepID=A0A9Q0ZXC9_SALVM|nr:hypothetical protein OIU85_000636 [Salix viminalis]
MRYTTARAWRALQFQIKGFCVANYSSLFDMIYLVTKTSLSSSRTLSLRAIASKLQGDPSHNSGLVDPYTNPGAQEIFGHWCSFQHNLSVNIRILRLDCHYSNSLLVLQGALAMNSYLQINANTFLSQHTRTLH